MVGREESTMYCGGFPKIRDLGFRFQGLKKALRELVWGPLGPLYYIFKKEPPK